MKNKMGWILLIAGMIVSTLVIVSFRAPGKTQILKSFNEFYEPAGLPTMPPETRIEIAGSEEGFTKAYIWLPEADGSEVKELFYFAYKNGKLEPLNYIGTWTAEICAQLNIPENLWP